MPDIIWGLIVFVIVVFFGWLIATLKTDIRRMETQFNDKLKDLNDKYWAVEDERIKLKERIDNLGTALGYTYKHHCEFERWEKRE